VTSSLTGTLQKQIFTENWVTDCRDFRPRSLAVRQKTTHQVRLTQLKWNRGRGSFRGTAEPLNHTKYHEGVDSQAPIVFLCNLQLKKQSPARRVRRAGD